MPAHKKPFFISLPLKRGMDSKRFREDIKDRYLDDFKMLLEIGYDEKKYVLSIINQFLVANNHLRFAAQLGFCRAKTFMENLLQEKYQQSLAPTLKVLESVCRKTEQEIVLVRK